MPPESFANVAHYLPRAAEQVPDHAAVRVPLAGGSRGEVAYHSLNFAELEAESTAVAALLRARGVVRGMRVLLMVKPGLDLVLVCFALFKTGAVPVVIDPGMGVGHFLRCLRRSQPEALVGIPLAHRLSRLFFWAFGSVRIRVVTGNGRFRRAVRDHRRLVASEGPPPVADSAVDELAAILFTSGSTGPPKGVAYEHGMFAAQVRLIRDQYGIEPGEVDLPMLPIFALFNPALGMTTVVPQMNPSKPATVDPKRIVDAIRQWEVTNSFGSPVLWTKVGRYCRERSIEMPSLRRILIAGAPVSPELIRLFGEVIPNGEIHTPYGATEALPVSSISGSRVLNETWELTEKGRGTCVGGVFPEMEARIISISDQPVSRYHASLELPPLEVGEIIVRGPVVTRAYDRLESQTAAAKIADTDGFWHRMGDLGYLDREGRFWFCGRKAERVRTARGDLYTDCCEAIFNRHPDVFRSALIGLGRPGEALPAIVVEPEKGKYPRGKSARTRFVAELGALARSEPHTTVIETFFFHRGFPVDVRHNAKIHRLTLARKFQ
jgi:acyl-CoA synthetase (AMP-forming)/AMP-acid ligase II